VKNKHGFKFEDVPWDIGEISFDDEKKQIK
jgi:hypothetical protein